jgi:hypothetical protein
VVTDAKAFIPFEVLAKLYAATRGVKGIKEWQRDQKIEPEKEQGNMFDQLFFGRLNEYEDKDPNQGQKGDQTEKRDMENIIFGKFHRYYTIE